MQFIITFAVIYLGSTFISKNMHIFTLEPKWIHIPSPTIYEFLIFPYNVLIQKNILNHNKQKLTFSELLFCLFNQIILMGTIILQCIPAMPCDVVEFSFGGRHRSLDIVVDTYNQKIPLSIILTLLLFELLVLFGEVLIRAVRKTEFRKKMGTGALIGILALCLFFVAGLIFSRYHLLF